MPRPFKPNPLKWSARDATGKSVPLYPGVHQGWGAAARADGLSASEVQRVRAACARDYNIQSNTSLLIVALCMAVLASMWFPRVRYLFGTLLVLIALAFVARVLWLLRPHPRTFILAMLDINRCPSCAYTLPHSAKSPEPVQCSECGSQWRYALD